MLTHRDRRATTPWPPLRLAASRSSDEGQRLRRDAWAGNQPALRSAPCRCPSSDDPGHCRCRVRTL